MRGPRCNVDNCPSRQYHFEDDGFKYCSEGHRHAELRIGEDEDAFGTVGKISRKKVEKIEKAQRHYLGRQAFELYLECYQLILWKQCHWLVKTKGFPAELEGIVRSFWSLRLQKLVDKVPEDLSDSETQSQLYSSQSEASDSEREKAAETGRRRGLRRSHLTNAPRLIETLGLCYFGIFLLRLPQTLGDVHDWASSGEMIYYQAINEVPWAMRERMPVKYREFLQPGNILQPDVLQNAVLDMAIMYQQSFGMEFPPLNHALRLYRHIKQLALPLEIYPAVLDLARLLGCTFTYPKERKPAVRYTDMPEVQMMALIVVALKLHFPFDGVRRHPSSPAEPSALIMDWGAWAKAMANFEETKHRSPGRRFQEAITTQEQDVFGMSRRQLDDYLDFYKSTFVEENPNATHFHQHLWTMFPTGSSISSTPNRHHESSTSSLEENEAAEMRKVVATQETMRPNEVIPEEDQPDDVLRTGHRYKDWRTASDPEPLAKTVVEVAAKLVALSPTMLVKAVVETEKKMQKWVKDHHP